MDARIITYFIECRIKECDYITVREIMEDAKDFLHNKYKISNIDICWRKEKRVVAVDIVVNREKVFEIGIDNRMLKGKV